MSYLQFPRLIFSGKFQTDPSTVNNDPGHFNTSKFQPNYQVEGKGSTNGWWNPNGTAAWRFKDCVVQQVEYLDGTTCDLPAVDPTVGREINSVVDRVEGKLVDLDSEQQMVSAIWGFQVFLGAKASEIGFGGDYEVASFGDIWVRYPAGTPDSFFSAYYQSVIDLTKQITGESDSRFLKELKDCLKAGAQLSIKFTVDGYNDISTETDFTFGRITGSIGVHHEDQPHQFISGRTLDVVPNSSPGLNTAYAVVQDEYIHMDLANSLPTTSPGGPLQQFGNLNLAVVDAKGNTHLIGEVHYEAANWYEKTAGISSFKMDKKLQKLVASNPLQLVQITAPNTFTPFLAEASNGEYVRADQFVFRFNPPENKKAKLYATQFGKPLKKAQISFQLDSSIMIGQQIGPTSPPAGTPNPKTGKYPVTFGKASPIKGTNGYSVTTNEKGVAEIEMDTTDPGNPRVFIDGQLFGIAYQLGDQPPAIGSIQNPSQILNLLVFNAYKIPDNPTWIEDVQPIFQQYADLYPVMKRIVDLGNFGNVIQHRSILVNVFQTPETNPNYMPVTRDLSKPKREMLLKWLQQPKPVYFDINSVEQLKKALQTAIELEHATIPTYLTAMYSLKPGANDQVAGLIRGVVIEEMLHMSLACNILISIGGSPNIAKPGFVPTFPGSLPGGLRNGLTVSLKKASIPQIRDVFMSIEMPDEMVQERLLWMDPNLGGRPRKKDADLSKHPAGKNLEYHTFTIGWFYDQIKASLTALTKAGKIKFGNADKQVSEWSGMGKLFVVEGLDDAIAAIDEILDQGEGNSATDPYDNDGELSHYYKFSEIVEGRRLVADGEGGYGYIGPKIPFNENEVFPMVDNPSQVNFPPGSRAEILSRQFDESYKALLLALHETFNGNPANLRESIGAMYSIGLQAVALMQTDSGLGDGTTAGPKFMIEY